MQQVANKENFKICLVGSSGGHLTHLYMLKPFWKEKNRFWVTFNKEDARSLLKGEKMYPCHYPTNRSLTQRKMDTFHSLIGKIIKRSIMMEKIMFGTIFLSNLPTLKKRKFTVVKMFICQGGH